MALVLFLVITGGACRKRKAPPTASQGEVISQPGPATPVTPGSKVARIPTQEDIYQATRKFMERNRRPAETVEDLVKAGLLAPLPPAPAGKKYVLDQRSASLELADQ